MTKGTEIMSKIWYELNVLKMYAINRNRSAFRKMVHFIPFVIFNIIWKALKVLPFGPIFHFHLYYRTPADWTAR